MLFNIVLLIVPLCGGQLIVNMKNKGNEILRESIQVKTIIIYTDRYALKKGRFNITVYVIRTFFSGLKNKSIFKDNGLLSWW